MLNGRSVICHRRCLNATPQRPALPDVLGSAQSEGGTRTGSHLVLTGRPVERPLSRRPSSVGAAAVTLLKGAAAPRLCLVY